MISERITQMNTEKEVVQDGKTKKKEKKLYLCFVDYQKASPANRQRCLGPSLIPQLDIQNGREGILDSNCQVLQRRRRKSRRAAEQVL